MVPLIQEYEDYIFFDMLMELKVNKRKKTTLFNSLCGRVGTSRRWKASPQEAWGSNRSI